MSAIVLLSSSPPQTFARSPTPVDCSSPLPSPGGILRDATQGSKRFKPASKSRNGFSNGFSTARSLLATKTGAENIPLRSPGKERFKTGSPIASQHRGATGSPRGRFILEKVDGRPDEHSGCFPPSQPQPPMVANDQECPPHADIFDLPDSTPPEKLSRVEESRHMGDSPLNLDKAVPRRLDWTPVKPSGKASNNTNEAVDHAASFSKGLLEDFTYAESKCPETNKLTTKMDVNGEPMKRRRIDFVVTANSLRETMPMLLPANNNQGKKGEMKGSRRRSKSPTKKMLTITGLATSHYGQDHGKSDRKVAPMLEYLTSTHLGAENEAGSATEQQAKPKPGRKKAGANKKAPARSRLVSPTSAMKAIESQEALFGSASQLARDESPTLLRDTLEALKKSECFLSSDPISPQRTQPISIESTSPYQCRGTSRFVKKKNLWSAAGRDEDNALLQVDTVDLVDSPAVRLALAGKDVLLQPAEPVFSKACDGPREQHAHVSDTPLIRKAGSLVDIDDIVTPAGVRSTVSPSKIQMRYYHTSNTSRPLEQVARTTELSKPEARPAEDVAPASSKPVPVKPCYAGFSTHDLQKQISAYGFKPVKKREKMIELLDRCWDDKHGIAPQEENCEAMTHGDFLSKVHDVSARPVPKVKKPRGKRKSETSGEPKPAKEPKKRKKAEPKSKRLSTEAAEVKKDTEAPAEQAKKAVRKRTSKKALSEEVVMDVDDIDADKEVDGGLDGGTLVGESTKPAATPFDSKTKPSLKQAPTPQANKPATPPPTLPPISFSSSPPAPVIGLQSGALGPLVQTASYSNHSPTEVNPPEETDKRPSSAGSLPAPGGPKTTVRKRKAATKSDPDPEPNTKPKPRTNAKTKAKAKSKTDPAAVQESPCTTSLTPDHTPPAALPDIKAQIHAAIHFRPQPQSQPQPQPPQDSRRTESGATQPETNSSSKAKAKACFSATARVPTWREKILMYDPIVLEDLTAWLNTQGFAAIGEDREVSALEVREWCEMNGVCCLWKGGWRGNRNKE
ncbi:hypothetical protein ABEF93_006832 [Exophiala dermatitidis]